MNLINLMTTLLESSTKAGALNTIYGYNGHSINVYVNSVRMYGDALFFIGREKTGKYLFIVANEENSETVDRFHGEIVPHNVFGNQLKAKRCQFVNQNASLLREIFPFTRPVLIGLSDSFGFGDRLGIANPAHIRSLAGSHMRPILAQQSIRELDRTQRTAEEVLNAASWAVFQEGYTAGFGADGDHLKTIDDIDRYARAGFTMFTFDPSAHVINEAITLSGTDLRQRAKKIETGDLRLDDCLLRYADKSFRLEGGTVLQPTTEEITRAFVKYGGVILHTAVLYRHLKKQHSSLNTEVELSVDETDIPTTPTEHLFVAGELKRMGVVWVSLAPRFIGDFEKGVDYRGDLNVFAAEYKRHAGIAQLLGPYKISIHSGSDKFGVYRMIGSLRMGNVHVKTAGTSYLEALRTVAKVEPKLIGEILDFARSNYEVARQSYHVTGKLDRVPSSEKCSEQQLQDLFNQHDARQVFHVTFGQVLSTRDADGKFIFRDRFMACLNQHEDVHYENIVNHFKRHLDPFKR
jgi:tagaturonate epimerase